MTATDAVWQAIDHHAARRDAYLRRTDPPPPSAQRLLTLAFGAVLSAILGALAVAEAGSHIESLWWLAIAVALAQVGVVPLRWKGVRVLARGWITGVIATTVAGCLVLALRLG